MSDGWPPTKCNMPNIDDLWGKNILLHILNGFFCGGGPKTLKSRALVTNYVRIVDQAVKQYKRARDAFDEYVNTPNDVISPLFVAVGYFEELIPTLKRAIRFADKIRMDKDCPPIPRTLSIFSSNTTRQITDLRNAIEHLDEQLCGGDLKEGDPVALLVKENSIELFNVEIKYSSLENWIRELEGMAKRLSTYIEGNA